MKPNALLRSDQQPNPNPVSTNRGQGPGAIARTTPATAYAATPKATPNTETTPEWRTRTDVIDAWGKVSLRYAGTLRHLGMGRAHIGEPVLMLIHDNHVITSNAITGEIIAEHTINPTSNYQRPHHRQ